MAKSQLHKVHAAAEVQQWLLLPAIKNLTCINPQSDCPRNDDFPTKTHPWFKAIRGIVKKLFAKINERL